MDIESEYCFPSHNLSCIKYRRSDMETYLMYTIFATASVCTVFLNLLVIISISHFKQLHTPTNLLLLSLAVADFVVGLIVMPVEGITFVETCWYFGEHFCAVFPVIAYVNLSASLSSLVYISIDRYIAVNDPLRYLAKVTVNRVIFCIIIGWLCSLLYAIGITYNHVQFPDTRSTCYGECYIVVDLVWGMIDIIAAVVIPCSTMLCLYLQIFCVAKHHAKQINLLSAEVGPECKMVRKKTSEVKAAKVLGIVVTVFLLCWVPYYIYLLSFENLTSQSAVLYLLTWLVYLNSCINPIIYAIFYPWFRRAAVHILTLRIFYSSSNLIVFS